MTRRLYKRPSLASRFGILGLGLLLLFVLACQIDAPVQFEGNCTIPPKLTTYLNDKPVAGCLAVFWRKQSPQESFVQPVVLEKSGTLNFRTEGGLTLPLKARGRELLYRLYLLSDARNKEVEKDQSQHQVLCTSMGLASYNCLGDPNKCWMFLKLQPIPQNEETKSFDLKLQREKKCQVCRPEVCDGVDNNCDGQVDEFDEEKNKPCAPKP